MLRQASNGRIRFRRRGTQACRQGQHPILAPAATCASLPFVQNAAKIGSPASRRSGVRRRLNMRRLLTLTPTEMLPKFAPRLRRSRPIRQVRLPAGRACSFALGLEEEHVPAHSEEVTTPWGNFPNGH